MPLNIPRLLRRSQSTSDITPTAQTAESPTPVTAHAQDAISASAPASITSGRISTMHTMAEALDNYSITDPLPQGISAEATSAIQQRAWYTAVRAANPSTPTIPALVNAGPGTNGGSVASREVGDLFTWGEVHSRRASFLPPLILTSNSLVGDRFISRSHDGYFHYDPAFQSLHTLLVSRDFPAPTPMNLADRRFLPGYAVRLFTEVPLPGEARDVRYRYIGDFYVRRTGEYLPPGRDGWRELTQVAQTQIIQRFRDYYTTPGAGGTTYDDNNIGQWLATSRYFPRVELFHAHRAPEGRAEYLAEMERRLERNAAEFTGMPVVQLVPIPIPAPVTVPIPAREPDSPSVYSQASYVPREDTPEIYREADEYAAASGVYVPTDDSDTDSLDTEDFYLEPPADVSGMQGQVQLRILVPAHTDTNAACVVEPDGAQAVLLHAGHPLYSPEEESGMSSFEGHEESSSQEVEFTDTEDTDAEVHPLAAPSSPAASPSATLPAYSADPARDFALPTDFWASIACMSIPESESEGYEGSAESDGSGEWGV